jgi:hypothetical protein
LTNIAHHHLAIAILFLIAGHMCKTNWGIGHGIKDILKAHKGPFTGQGLKGIYEILTTSRHAQLALNLAMVDMSACKIFASSFILANTILVDSFIALRIVAWSFNLVASTFSLSSINFSCCVSIIDFHLESDLLHVSLELMLMDSTIKEMKASMPLVAEDPACFAALAFLTPASLVDVAMGA